MVKGRLRQTDPRVLNAMMSKSIKISSGEIVKLKTNFKAEDKLGAFYSGGPVQFSGDGQHIFTTCSNAVKVVSCSTGRVEYSVEEEEDHVTCFTASDDGEWLVVGWRSLLLKQYHWKTEKCIRSWKGHIGPVMSMAFDASSTLLATGSSDSIVKVWDCEKQYCTHNFRGCKGVVNLVRFHPDRSTLHLFTSSADCNIRVWDLTSSECVQILSNHVSAITCLGFSEDGQTLLSGGRDQVIHVWDLETGTTIKTIPVFESLEGLVVLPSMLQEQNGPIKQALDTNEATTKTSQYSPILFATAGSKGVIQVWSTDKPHPLHSLEPLAKSHDLQECEETEGEEREMTTTPSTYVGLLHSQSLKMIAAVTYDHNITFLDTQFFQIQKQFIGYLDEILDMRFVGESNELLAVATNSEQVKVFEKSSFSCHLLTGHTGIVLSLDCSPDGTVLATSSKDNTIRLWRLKKSSNQFECVGVGTGHTHAVGAVVVARVKGNFVVSAGQDCTLKMWSARGVIKGSQKGDVMKLKVKYTQLAHDKDINSLDVSPNDKLVATGSQDKTAKLWQASDGNLLGTFCGHKRGIWSVKFSPVDQCLLTASGDATLKLWALRDFTCIKTFEGHTNSVLKAIFLTKGMQIASSGSDGLVKLWAIKTNECVATMDEHTEKIWSLATSSDGEVLVSGGADSVICLWRDVSEEEECQANAERELQLLREQDLSNFLHQKNYMKAVGVALTLDQPFRTRTILQELLENGGIDGEFTEVIHSLREDQIHSILKHASRWNQNARHCRVAQSVLTVILKKYSHEELLKMDDLKPVLENLISYTERHFQRVLRLQQLSKFVEYTAQCMKLPSLPTSISEPVPMETSAQSPNTLVATADSSTTSEAADGAERQFPDSSREACTHSELDHVTSTTDIGNDEKESRHFKKRKQKVREKLKKHKKQLLAKKRAVMSLHTSSSFFPKTKRVESR